MHELKEKTKNDFFVKKLNNSLRRFIDRFVLFSILNFAFFVMIIGIWSFYIIKYLVLEKENVFADKSYSKVAQEMHEKMLSFFASLTAQIS